ncbi:molybdopterin-guanine dinucleotide biosynthesis protein B [Psychromonas ossibalaenae]|uniref:molybdopterin-guanine dinucleotide biosynthesis protein B n=1 Tax=Psychromonas ossibalaenae TaxID=444922 RepID=UPI00037C4396|nr:molybdopterin-guanine dinucleotide biosynthesis protein B [Psychromonas ossibalaenae]
MSVLADFPIPLLGFAAFSGTGKTTLLEKLIPLLTAQGLNVALVKHSHHDIEMDKPGKDSYRLRKAGASQVVLAGTHRSILFSEHGQKRDSRLLEQLALLQTDSLDLVLVEGFRDEIFNKIELHRSALNKPFLFKSDSSVIALACDQTVKNCPLPQIDLNDLHALEQFVLEFAKA